MDKENHEIIQEAYENLDLYISMDSLTTKEQLDLVLAKHHLAKLLEG